MSIAWPNILQFPSPDNANAVHSDLMRCFAYLTLCYVFFFSIFFI